MPAMDSAGHESESKHLLEAQLRATLNVIPAYTWYAAPSGALTFVMNDMRIISVSRRIILSVSVSTWAQSGIPISPFCIRMITPRCVELGHTAYEPAVLVR